MENGYNGNVSADSILWARGSGFGGYNYGGNCGDFANLSSNGVRADRNVGTTRDMAHSIHGQIATNANCLHGQINGAVDRISDQNEENRRYAQNTAIIDTMINGEFRLGDKIEENRRESQTAELRIADKFTAARDQSVNFEFRQIDRLRDIERENAANARIAADRCCETQKEILKLEASNNLQFAGVSKQAAIDHGATTARLAAIEAKIDANKEISELRAQLQTQQIFATCGCGCGGGVKPCPTPV